MIDLTNFFETLKTTVFINIGTIFKNWLTLFIATTLFFAFISIFKRDFRKGSAWAIWLVFQIAIAIISFMVTPMIFLVGGN